MIEQSPNIIGVIHPIVVISFKQKKLSSCQINVAFRSMVIFLFIFMHLLLIIQEDAHCGFDKVERQRLDSFQGLLSELYGKG